MNNLKFYIVTVLANAKSLTATALQSTANNAVNTLTTAINGLVTTTPTQPTTPYCSSKNSAPFLTVFLDVNKGYGYVVGGTATVSWIIAGIANLGQIATLSFIKDGVVQHVANVMLSDGSYKHTFIMTHNSLDIVLTFAGDNLNYGSLAKVSTFVYHVNSLRTFTEIKKIDNLTVAKKVILRLWFVIIKVKLSKMVKLF